MRMAVNPYDQCPCGSGKKFKWCCQDIYTDIDAAFEQAAAGQHEAAIRKLDDVVAAHPGNPEAHGRRAQLLASLGRIDDAEAALERAFAINPDYPFGHLLRAELRAAEGELIGALKLLRRAADLYDPEAHAQLAIIHDEIAEIELKLNRPVAARAALLRAIRYSNAQELRENLKAIFGANSRYPASACKDYGFKRPAAASANWDRALQHAASGRLSDVHRVFQLWTQKHPDDPAAWFNLGLVNAWLGDNAAAVDALAAYVEREPDEIQAGQAWTLAEILRCGHGLEADADYVEHRYLMAVVNGEPIAAMLEDWHKSHRLIVTGRNIEAGVLTALVLEETTSLVLSGASAPPARLAAYLILTPSLLHLSHPQNEPVERIVASLKEKIGAALGETEHVVGPVRFGDVVAEALLFPTSATTQLDAETKIRNHAQAYFEETWIHRPLKSLMGAPPIDAAGHAGLRKRLRGVIQFLEECSAQTNIRLYDFARLRHKLRLDEASANEPPAAGGVRDFAAMNAAEIAALDPAALTDSELEQAFRAAVRLDAAEVAGQLAEQGITRPAPSPDGDRWPFFNFLINSHLRSGEFDRALEISDRAAAEDQGAGGGRHAHELALRRGQILSRKGDAAAAAAAFDVLLSEPTVEAQHLGAAAEALLSASQPEAALRFADQGLARAREQNNRDLEGYFLELTDAARRRLG